MPILAGPALNGLRTNFSTSLLLLTLVVGAGVVVLVLARSRGLDRTRTVRVLTALAAAGAVVATGLPRSWPVERYGFGDLILSPGGDTLGYLGQTLAAPGSLAFLLLVGNVVVYVPVGLLAALGWGPRQALLGGVALSVAVETMQLLLLDRTAATDDVLVNGLGVVLGVLLALPVVVRFRAGRGHQLRAAG